MGIAKGLKALEAAIDRVSGDFEKAKWLKINPGKAVRVAFLQEIDPDSEYFDPKNGTAVLAVEHSNPKNYKAKAVCTADSEGRCWACEQNMRHPKTGWNPRSRLYINVLADDGIEDPYVAILAQGVSDRGIVPSLAMVAQDRGGITQNQFRIRRTGEKTKTSYTIMPVEGSEGVPTDGLELYDIEKVCLRNIPYEEQEAFYTGADSDLDEEPVAQSTTSRQIDW
jgi:hypothetical protein